MISGGLKEVCRRCGSTQKRLPHESVSMANHSWLVRAPKWGSITTRDRNPKKAVWLQICQHNFRTESMIMCTITIMFGENEKTFMTKVFVLLIFPSSFLIFSSFFCGRFFVFTRLQLTDKSETNQINIQHPLLWSPWISGVGQL